MTKPDLTGFLLPEALLAKSAFKILTAGTLEVYDRSARQVFQLWTSHDGSKALSVEPDELLSVAREHWRTLLRSSYREPNEAELAVLLLPLSASSVPGVEEFLHVLSLTETPSTNWISAYARFLSRQRATNSVDFLPLHSSDTVRDATTALVEEELTVSDEASYALEWIPAVDSRLAAA